MKKAWLKLPILFLVIVFCTLAMRVYAVSSSETASGTPGELLSSVLPTVTVTYTNNAPNLSASNLTANASTTVSGNKLTIEISTFHYYKKGFLKDTKKTYQTSFSISITAPSDSTVYFKENGSAKSIKPGETFVFKGSSDSETYSDSFENAFSSARKNYTFEVVSIVKKTPKNIVLCQSVGGSVDLSVMAGTNTVASPVEIGKKYENVTSLVINGVSAAAGYEFVGWVADNANLTTDTPYVLSKATSGSLAESLPEATIYLTPSFVKTDAATYYLEGDASTQYRCLDEADAAAVEQGKNIILAADGIVYGLLGQSDLYISSGVTLVLPYTEGGTAVQDASAGLKYANFVGSTTNPAANDPLDPSKDVSYTLTIPSGITVHCNGTIAVGGTIVGGGYPGACYGAHANIQLNGTLEVEQLGILSVCGYIIGDGKVVANNKATIYQPLVIFDYSNSGRITLALAGAAAEIDANKFYQALFATGLHKVTTPTVQGETAVLPFERYAMINIQAEIRMNYGSSMGGYVDIYANDQHNYTTSTMIGSGGLLTIDSEGSSIRIQYDGTNKTVSACGKSVLNCEGDFSFGSFILRLTPIDGVTAVIDSKKLFFVIPFNYTFNFSGGTISIPSDKSLKLLPGCVVNINEKATLKVQGTLAVYDGYCTHKSHGAAYPTTASLMKAGFSGTAVLKINNGAEMVISGSFGGIVQTDGGGKITVSTSSLQITTRNYAAGVQSLMGTDVAITGATMRTLKAQICDTDGNLIDMQNGMTYYGLSSEAVTELGSYTYNAYLDSASPNTPTSKTVASGQSIDGVWYIATLNVHSSAKREDGLIINAEYRLQDYLWLNAICYFDKSYVSVDPAKLSITLEGADTVVVEGDDGLPVIYIVKKVPADEIADAISFIIEYDGKMSAPVTVSIRDCKDGTTATDELVDALLAYGEAAKKYFVTGGAPDVKLNPESIKDSLKGSTAFGKTAEKAGSYNKNGTTVTLTTKGANVLFEERLSLMFGFQFSSTGMTAEDFLQVGVLVGSSDLTTGMTVGGENVKTAYILYNNSLFTGDGINKPYLPEDAEYEVSDRSSVTWDKLNADGRMVLYMDLLSVDYTSAIEFRPYAIAKDGTVIYGQQYAYGLADYINNMLYDEKLGDYIGGKNVDAFRNLLITTWNYALKAKAKFATAN